jgi:poly(3-hydroxybutyrate) depolymerase
VLVREREWNEEEDAFVLISREHAIKVAHAVLEAAGHGDIEFVRPCGGGYEDVPIQPAVAAMMAARSDIDWKVVNEIEADTEPRPKDPTATERQRRRRAKQCDGERDMNRDSVTVTNGHALPLLEYKELAA